MSIKSKLLEEIEAKAQKIREKRIEAASNKTIEAAVFEFFKNIEESRQLHMGLMYDDTLFFKARAALTERLKGFDHKVKISVEYSTQTISESAFIAETNMVRGVTIWWSQDYIKKNNVHHSFYIDINQMLFI
jgi:epoxyqueuosine reductase QueG